MKKIIWFALFGNMLFCLTGFSAPQSDFDCSLSLSGASAPSLEFVVPYQKTTSLTYAGFLINVSNSEFYPTIQVTEPTTGAEASTTNGEIRNLSMTLKAANNRMDIWCRPQN